MADQTVIDVLRGVLARAESGQITGVAIATCHSDLCTGSAWSMEEASLAELLGSVAIMQCRLVNHADPPPRDVVAA